MGACRVYCKSKHSASLGLGQSREGTVVGIEQEVELERWTRVNPR